MCVKIKAPLFANATDANKPLPASENINNLYFVSVLVFILTQSESRSQICALNLASHSSVYICGL